MLQSVGNEEAFFGSSSPEWDGHKKQEATKRGTSETIMTRCNFLGKCLIIKGRFFKTAKIGAETVQFWFPKLWWFEGTKKREIAWFVRQSVRQSWATKLADQVFREAFHLLPTFWVANPRIHGGCFGVWGIPPAKPSNWTRLLYCALCFALILSWY